MNIKQPHMIGQFSPMVTPEGVHFRVWAPHVKHMQLVLETEGQRQAFSMDKSDDGFFSLFRAGARAGQLYLYRPDGKGSFPDPASRFQPRGVHGPSQVIDSSYYIWGDDDWLSRPHTFRTLYEIHTGAFTKEGTFAAIEKHLPDLAALGIDAIELMPLADFPGKRNWGYDGVNLFATARCYGTPDELRHLVDKAHAKGLGVFLDVVYNHLGPDGNYLGEYSPYFFSKEHTCPWGAAVNLDGEESGAVRRFFIENAIAWLTDYHFDGLRLDATHAFVDDSQEHFLAQFSREVRKAVGRPVTLVAEDCRNLNQIVMPLNEGGYGFDAVWADDFHHGVRRLTAGDNEGYFADFAGTTDEIAKALNQGWVFEGEFSKFLETFRGTSARGLRPENFVLCIQNHDQVGNRAMGERINHQISEAAYKAVSTLLLLAPERTLLFMGQEWSAASPFIFFTDHNEELGARVIEGRRREFAGFAHFRDPESCGLIPDPQSDAAFVRSRLNHEEKQEPAHLKMRNYYRRLLKLRRELGKPGFQYRFLPYDKDTLIAAINGEKESFLAAVRLSGAGPVNIGDFLKAADGMKWEIYLTSEDEPFTVLPQPIHVSGNEISFSSPGAAILRQSV